MRYFSTRGQAPAVTFSEALQAGLAPDGGLYVPEKFPRHTLQEFHGLSGISEIAARFIAPFLTGDELQSRIDGICSRAFRFPIPLKDLDPKTSVLELFHGPTAAFKDVGASFLAECLQEIHKNDSRMKTVLVATSGDTGGAVAAAFHGKPQVEVVILYPRGKVSARQEQQLTAWGANIRAFAVAGDFDDCQRLVKEAFLDPGLQKRKKLISANSINIGRLLPQAVYYVAASLKKSRDGAPVDFVVPSGNLGNAVAALWAKRCGFPIGRVVLATNANRSIPDYLASGEWKPQPTVATLANAMDVGNPSNMERLRALYPTREALLKDVDSISVSDETISRIIGEGPVRYGEVWCPHTATAVHAAEKLFTQSDGKRVIVATAHPAKFETIVEPKIGRAVEVPAALAELLKRPSQKSELSPDLSALLEKI